MIEEETGTPLDIKAPSPVPTAAGDAAEAKTSSGEAKLIARDDKKNPLISTFDWSTDAAQRILRVPAGFMRNKTQERVEGLARERALTAIDLGLVEEGIEIGKEDHGRSDRELSDSGQGRGGRRRRHQWATAPRQRTRLRKRKARTLRKLKAKLKWSRPSAAATSTR